MAACQLILTTSLRTTLALYSVSAVASFYAKNTCYDSLTVLASGIFNAFSAVTGFVGVYIAGWILQSTGNNWAYVFIFTAAQCIIGSVIYGTLGTGSKII